MFGVFKREKKEGEGEIGTMSNQEGERPRDDNDGKIIENEPFSSEATAMSSDNSAAPPDGSEGESQITNSDIGIVGLIDKRAKLEEAIDYVGLMIKNLKDKRTSLEKEIEDESVDIKNLKEKLEKVNEYINEENRGIESLTQKRVSVEQEADVVANMINEFRSKLSGLDNIIDSEGKNIKQIKQSRENSTDLKI